MLESPAPAPALATPAPASPATPSPPPRPSPPLPESPPPPLSYTYPAPGALLTPGGSGSSPIPGFGTPGPVPQALVVPPAEAPQPPPPPPPPPPSEPPHTIDPSEGSVHGLSVHNADDVHSRVDPLPPGRNPKISKQLNTPAEIWELYRELTENATPLPLKPGYKGEWQILEDGTRIGIRTESGSGGVTIDIVYPDGEKMKVHLPMEKRPPPPASAPAPAPAPAPIPVQPDPGGPVVRLPTVEPPPPQQTLTIWAILGLLAAAALSPA